MRLLQCHIENFGKLHDVSFDLTKDISVICEQNGWGKSTFAGFLLAMFYGLPGGRKTKVDENPRKKYMPWQGGPFGGQITFEAGGKTYVLNRIFSRKESLDEFELRDAATNLLSSDYSDKIGEELFHINRESFLRTVFIGQNDLNVSLTDDINAKISNLADDTDDMNQYESAMNRLKDMINALSPNRATGSVSKRESEITEVWARVNQGSAIGDQIKQCQKLLDQEQNKFKDLKDRKENLGKMQAKVAASQGTLVKRENFYELKEKVEIKNRKFEEISRFFPGDIPSKDQMNAMSDLCTAYESEIQKMEGVRLSPSDEKKLADYRLKFVSHIPSEEELREKSELCQEIYRRKQESAQGQMLPSEIKRFEILSALYENDEESVAAVSAGWNTRNTKAASLPLKKAACGTLKSSACETKNMIPIYIGGLLLLCGFAVIFLGMKIPGLVIMVAGIAALGISLLSGRKDPVASQGGQMNSILNEIRADEEYIKETDLKVAAYLHAHEREFDEISASAVLQEMTGEFIEYKALKKKKELSEHYCNQSKLSEMEKDMIDYLFSFGIVCRENDLSSGIYELRDQVREYKSLDLRSGEFSRLREKAVSMEKETTGFFAGLSLPVPQKNNLRRTLQEIRDKADDYEDAATARKEAEKDLIRFKEENDLPLILREELTKDLPSLDSLSESLKYTSEELENSHSRILSMENELSILESKYDEWEQDQRLLEELKKCQRTEKEKHKNLEKAKEYLKKAKESITARYSDPIYESFCGYYRMIAGESAGDYHIDANVSVTRKEKGKQRTLDYLSAGYKDLISFCLRLALVDAMYDTEKPVLILDDPFVNLDDEKAAMGLKLLLEVSEKYQVIYFTCSKMRNLK